MKANPITTIAMITAITIAALAVSWEWGLVHWPPSVLSNASEREADIIRRVMPLRLVNPDRLQSSAHGDLIFLWWAAETKVRLSAIWIVWLVVVAVSLKRRNTWPNGKR